MSEPEEIWRPITGCFPYEISSLGRVKGQKGFIKPQENAYEYFQFGVYKQDGTKVTKAVHVVMCEEFLGPKPSPEMMALHSDDIKSHNVIGNLYWGTHTQNMLDKTKHVRGNSNKLNWDQVREIRAKHKQGVNQYRLAEEYSMSVPAISNIVLYKTWKESVNG